MTAFLFWLSYFECMPPVKNKTKILCMCICISAISCVCLNSHLLSLFFFAEMEKASWKWEVLCHWLVQRQIENGRRMKCWEARVWRGNKRKKRREGHSCTIFFSDSRSSTALVKLEGSKKKSLTSSILDDWYIRIMANNHFRTLIISQSAFYSLNLPHALWVRNKHTQTDVSWVFIMGDLH